MKNKKLTLGGCALNSARASVHWLKRKGKSAKIYNAGSIGKDVIGKRIISETKKAGVKELFSIISKAPTGTVISLTNGRERTLCANIGAAKLYETAFLQARMA